MNINYKIEYYELLNKLKQEINNKKMSKKALDRYLKYLENITNELHNNSFSYLNSCINLMYLFEKISKYPDKDEEKVTEDIDRSDLCSSDITKIKKNIDKLINKIKNNKREMTKSEIKLITYLVILATFLSIPISAITNYKKDGKDKLYKTDRESILLIDNVLLPEYPNINIPYTNFPERNVNVLIDEYVKSKQNKLNYSSSYEKTIYPEGVVYIKEYSPYENDNNNKSTRKVTTYEIKDEAILNILSEKSLETIIANYDSVSLKDILFNLYSLENILSSSVSFTEYEHVPSSTIPTGILKYPETTYEIIKINQDLEDYTLSLSYRKTLDLIIILLGNLFVYLCIIEMNNMTTIEYLIKQINIILTHYELNIKQSKKLNKLLKKYLVLANQNDKTKKMVKVIYNH